jgi:uncharacterized protein (DUF952 family)
MRQSFAIRGSLFFLFLVGNSRAFFLGGMSAFIKRSKNKSTAPVARRVFRARYSLQGLPIPFLKLHEAIVVENVDAKLEFFTLYDFLPLEPTALETVRRVAFLQPVAGVVRKKDLLSRPRDLEFLGWTKSTDDHIQDFLSSYNRELLILRNDCSTFVRLFRAAHLR